MSKLSILRGVNTMPLQALLERPVAYHRSFVALGAGITGALMLSQAVYWSSRTNDKDGWFYKSQAEWEEETGMTRSEQEKSRRALKAGGFLDEVRKGLPAKLFYRVNLEAVAAALKGDLKTVSLDEVLKTYSAALKSLSKTGYMRAMKAGVTAEKVDYAEVLRSCGMVCGCCGKAITRGPGRTATSLAFDHKSPISKGGPHVLENLQPTHFKCNTIKGSSEEEIKFALPEQTSLIPDNAQAGYLGASITENTTESTSSSSPGAEAVTDHSEQIEDIFAGRHYRPMTIGWKPIEKSMKVYAFKQGVSMALLTGDVLAAFQCHWSAHPEVEDTAEGWTNRLVKWAKAERVRSELAPSAKTDDLPYDEIVDAYHKACPRLAPVTLIDNKLKSLIAERWEEHEAHQDISFWSDYFAAAGRLAEVFYRGKKRKPYCEAMLCRDVFRDVMEGRENA